MSDIPKTAPDMSKQFVRAAILIAILGVSVTFTSSNSNQYQHVLTLVHLLSFMSWFGCSIWVSFVGGIIMFQNLPRHTFGRLQSKLFPAYFLFSAIAIVLSIASATALSWSRNNGTMSLYLILATILINLVYLEPKTTQVMFERHVVERKLGTGQEVGIIKPKDPKIANDPELKKLSKTFGMLHGMSTLMNLAALGVGCYWANVLTHQMISV
ncbi:protein of unknown function DUF4149 containing protein [Nitzschia inconspicua]|uniref:TMEM205-like domain-containing protein n=1 Tax=Nitzschia inconspicua TaxID=303405 RepID=A0A9K3PIA4_9STRA|nr:protein of unknown function DUF4149 containing protein [Nitzschia inconspicua]